MSPDGVDDSSRASRDYLQNLYGLHGRVALVTGSTAGIGLALATALGLAGATIVVNGRSIERVAAAVDRLKSGGITAAGSSFDVTDEDAVVIALNRLHHEVGPVDVLVNNAGVQHREPLLDVRLEDFIRVLTTNLTAAFIVARAVAARAIADGRPAKIVNVTSLASAITRADVGAYTAAKTGLRGLTRSMTAEWGQHGIQVNALAPGHVLTEMTHDKAQDPAFDSWVRTRTPAGRWSTRADLAGAVVFLASRASDYVNGHSLFVDGGTTAVM